MRIRGTEIRELFDRYANMLSARRPRNNKRKFSSRTHIAALSNHSAPHSTPSDHAAENEELRQLLRDAKESIYRLTGRDSSTPTDTTPKSSGVAPPALRCSLPGRAPFGSRDPEPDGYSPRPARSAISDSKIGRSTEQAQQEGRSTPFKRGATPAVPGAHSHSTGNHLLHTRE